MDAYGQHPPDVRASMGLASRTFLVWQLNFAPVWGGCQGHRAINMLLQVCFVSGRASRSGWYAQASVFIKNIKISLAVVFCTCALGLGHAAAPAGCGARAWPPGVGAAAGQACALTIRAGCFNSKAMRNAQGARIFLFVNIARHACECHGHASSGRQLLAGLP